ncbi:thioredoxin-related transmembrane protein 1-like [Daphnia pulex]|uniref:thioredoxin-related transmembrane protein 1-like n=1 Tax=Daphnia pulex TaxID=6669 RepID=UPI001EDFB329|nr:thioredoxin-related transmembrane protein 1-like [Daphnia pulex]
MTPIRNFCFVASLLFTIVNCAPLKVLDEQNWDEMLNGEWMVEFYAPWCPACRALEPVWVDFASWSDDLGIKVGHVDVTTSPGLSGRFMVTALPTIYHVKNGVFRQYRGTRDKDEFISFVEEKKWEQVEPIPGWKSPSSIQMSIVSGFFKLSMMLRNIHTQITEEHGIPYWGSYLLFALATIIVGAVLGLVLVFLIDCFYPAKVAVKRSDLNKASKQNEKDDDDEDILDENTQSEGKDEDDEFSQSEQDEAMADEGSQDDEEVNEKNKEETAEEGPSSSSPDVRKRRSRKAD